jgi:hypothetical protein
MRRDEQRIVDALANPLEECGWQVRREVDFCDLVAKRDGETLYVGPYQSDRARRRHALRPALAPHADRRGPGGAFCLGAYGWAWLLWGDS